MDNALSDLGKQLPGIQTEISTLKDTADTLSQKNKKIQSGYQSNLSAAGEQYAGYTGKCCEFRNYRSAGQKK